jgi:hypothetical protein
MATFLLRRIDDALWQRFVAKAAAQGITPKALLLRIIKACVDGQ